MRLVIVPLATVLVLAAGAGCGGDEASSADTSSLEGTAWVLVSGVEVDGWEDVAPSATFADGTVSGATGCNRFGAEYTVDGEALELGEIAATTMGCGAPADAVEREYSAALQSVRGWRSEDGELVLLDADGAELLRYRAASPVGTWEATAILRDDAFASPIEGTEITAAFAEDGTLTGSAGCNTYTATFTTDGGGIEIDAPAATKKACAEPEGIMEQEAAYLAALPLAVRFEIAGPALSLLTAEGTFVASYALAPSP